MNRRFGIAAVASLAALGCDAGVDPSAAHGTAPPALPAGGVEIPAGGDALRQALADPLRGDLLRLLPGTHRGPVVIDRPVTIVGPRDAVIRSGGAGTTVAVDAADVTLIGFTVDGSGNRFDLLDAAVRVHGERARVDGLAVVDALFGILVEKVSGVVVRGCEVHGVGGEAMGLRGDGIRLWETSDSEVVDNVVTDSRDCVVWYSSGNRISGNTVLRCRYGTHFMYSHDNEVVGNRYVDDVVGIFVMYSRDVTILHNVLARAGGAAGVGLGVKESGNLIVEDNDFVANRTGVYLDTSPLDLEHHNRFARNRIRLSDTAIGFHSSPHRNRFVDNDLRDNVRQVTVGGDGDARQADFERNHFDDYQGYDLDGDGFGDIRYELRSLSSQLTSRFPSLEFFRGTPVLGAAEIAGHVVPLFEPKTLVVDPEPRMRSPLQEEARDAR